MKSQNTSRRDFLKLAGAASVSAALPLVSPAIGLASMGRGVQVAQENRMMMGTIVGITVLDSSQDRAAKAMEAGFAAIKALTPVFDRHAANGLIHRLNSDHKISGLPPILKQVLSMCHKVRAETAGAFDPTVAPVVDAFKESFQKTGQAPSHQALDRALKAVGGVKREGGSLLITAEGGGLTLDGIAKGFLADAAKAAMAKAGAKCGLVNAGGDIAILGDRAGRPWHIGVADPASPREAKLVIKAKGGAVATSGNYEIYYDREKLYHHIVNPASGASPKSDVSSSVRAGSAAVADALATACFVMKPGQAMAFLKARPGLEGLVYTKTGQRYMTKGFMG